MLDLPQIEAFVAVATDGSFAKAAASLFLTQPSVSARVQGLERELGQWLFERTGRGVRLTRACGVFLPIAERLLETVAEGQQALEAPSQARGACSRSPRRGVVDQVRQGQQRLDPHHGVLPARGSPAQRRCYYGPSLGLRGARRVVTASTPPGPAPGRSRPCRRWASSR